MPLVINNRQEVNLGVKSRYRGWRGGWAVKSAYCSYGEDPGLVLSVGSQAPVTTAPGDLSTSLGLHWRLCTWMYIFTSTRAEGQLV